MKPLRLQATRIQTYLRQCAYTILPLLCCLIGFQPAAMGQFLPATNYPTVGSTPVSIAIGDFDGDGIPDLATANQYGALSARSVSVLLGNGDGTFKPAAEYGTGGNITVSIAAGDFNGDGLLDLAIVNQTSGGGADAAQLDLLLGNGDGTFRQGMSYTVGYLGRSVATGDFNADGRLDLVVATAGGTFIYLGNGDGTFETPTDIGGGGGLNGIVVADLNHDGKLDVAATNYNGNTVDVLLGNGDGTFRPYGNYPTDDGPETVEIGDFNGDGNLDIVVANAGNTFGTTVSVLLGNGDGTFKSTANYFAGSEPISVAVGDIDGDGKLDLIVSDFGARTNGNEVSLLRGNGNGTFQPPIFFVADTGPEFVAIADLNNDGRLDVVVADFENNDVSVLLNAGPPLSPPNLVTTQFLTRSGGSVLVQLTVANIGGDAASNVVITDVKVGADQAMLLPQNIGTIAGGTSMQVILTVPGNVGAPGAASLLRVSGTFTGETFGASFRVTLP